jgi:hypothetical protein
MAAAQAAARRAVEAIERQVRERTEAGLHTDGLPDFSTEGERDGYYQAQLIRELAVRHVMGWTGVELEGGPAPLTPKNIAAVTEIYPIDERFFQEFTLRQVLLNSAENGLGSSAAGISSRAEGPNIAAPAATTACPAHEAKPEPLDARPIEEVTIARAAMTPRPAAQWALSVSATGRMERSHQQRAQSERLSQAALLQI